MYKTLKEFRETDGKAANKELLDTNPKAVVINAATPMGLGMVKGVREEYVKRGQFIDVVIAEENYGFRPR